MPKRCPRCKTLNSTSAPRCVNCDFRFSADAADEPPPAVIPTPAPPPPPVGELQHQAAQHEKEVAEVRALVDRLEKELAERQTQLADRHNELERLRTIAEQRQAPDSGAVNASSTPKWMASALALAAAWPRLASAVAAVVTLGAGYGGVSSCRNFISPAQVETGRADSTVPAVVPSPRSGAADDRDKTLTTREGDLNTKEAAVKNRETDVATKEQNLKTREADLAARDKALKSRADEVASQAAKAEPRMGFFDFDLPRGNDAIMLTRANARGAWPSRDCTIVSVSPLDRDEVPPSFASLCRTDRIVLDRPKGPKRSVRVVWVLN